MSKKDELINKIFFKKYKIIRKIGKGSFGLVYLGNIIKSENYVAVKFESKSQTELILERESYLLYYLRGFGIPEVITFGHNKKYNILVQTLLGNSINEIFHQNHRHFSMKDCCMIGIQMLDRIEYIHSKYIIHRDIKPDNFLVGKNDKSLIYLIDFGLAKKYMSSRTGRHCKFCINKKWSGTSRFASANSLRGVEQSRRDDLESLCYILLLIMRGSLPWDNIFGYSENDDILLIYKIKKFMKPELLFSNLPKEASEFFKYCKNLDFEQKPDYNYLRSLLLDILNNQNEKNDLNFSWLIQNENLNSKKEKYNQYKQSHKRKNSPQQRLYNSLLNAQIKLTKKSESFKELNFEEELNKVKRDCIPIKNISPSPRQREQIFNEVKNDEKFKYFKKIPKGQKRIINIAPYALKKNFFTQNVNNVIEKTNTETKRINDKRINIIPLQSMGYKIIKKKENMEKENNTIMKKGTYFNDVLKEIKEVYNKIIIKKNNSYTIKDFKRLFPYKIINIKENMKLNNDQSKQNINNNKESDKFSFNIKFNNYAFENRSFNQTKICKKNNHALQNSILNNNINFISIPKNTNNKIESENIYFNSNKMNNNAFVFPKYLKINHISPENFNKYRLKIKNDKKNYSNDKLNKKQFNQNKNVKLNSEKNNEPNTSNIIKNNNTFIANDKIFIRPQKNIKIINIITPKNKVSSYYKVKKNIFTSKANLYKNENSKYKNVNNNAINNKLNSNNKKDLITDYYSNSSLIENYKKKDKIPKSKSPFNYTLINNNNYREKIVKTNSCFLSNKLSSNNNSIIYIKLKKNLLCGSMRYKSPKSIEKYKTKY